MASNIVLVVEDDVATAAMMERYLATLGLSVHIAYDGEEALAILHEDCTVYGAVLLDIAMPRMSGLKLAELIREQLSCDLPLIALTARSSPELNQVTADAGITTVLNKPFKPAALKALLNDLGLLY